MIICADFDGTIFFREDEARTAENLRCLKKWREVGNTSMLATNRSLQSLNHVLPSWQEYFDFLILDNGNRIINPENKLIWSNTFNSEKLNKMLEAAEQNPVKPKIAFYGVNDDDFTLEKPNSPLTKIRFWFQKDADATAFLPKIKAINDRAFVWSHDLTFSWNPTDVLRGCYAVVDVAPNDTSKAVAIRALLKTVDMASDNIVTVGDNDNDYEMLAEFDGYTIEGSKIATTHPKLPTTSSVAALIKKRLVE